MAEGSWRRPVVEADNFWPVRRLSAEEEEAAWDAIEKATDCLKIENDAAAAEQALRDREPFDLTLIPYEALRRLGVILVEGISKYGRYNWRHGVGDKQYQLECANHALKHLLIYIHWLQFGEKLGQGGEDDLAKVMWFCVTQAELERLEQGRSGK